MTFKRSSPLGQARESSSLDEDDRLRYRVAMFGAALAVMLVFLPIAGGLYVYMHPRSGPRDVHSKDGDPPNLEMASLDISKEIDNEIKQLKPGEILFNPASEMKVGLTERVEVRIAKSLSVDLEQGLKGRGLQQAEKIKVSSYMGVVLSGTEGFFNITLKNREQKIVTDDAYTEWIFDVTPLKQGNPSLYLTAYNVIVTAAGDRTYEHPAFRKEIKVRTSFASTVTRFLRDNWKEIAALVVGSGIVSGFVGWILSKIRKRRQQRRQPPPWERGS